MADTAIAIRAEHLTKLYGRQTGVLDLSLDVNAGEVFGFLGPNGAGKTTMIRLVLDLIRPTRGRIEVFGSNSRRDVALRRRVGYLPGDLRLYERLTARELCAYFAHLRRLDGIDRAEEYASRLELPLDRPIGSLSKGNRQKVGLVQAFMHQPDLLVLDEPTAGLDPLIQQTFYELVAEARSAGATVFLSSHVLREVQHVADRVALIRDGRARALPGRGDRPSRRRDRDCRCRCRRGIPAELALRARQRSEAAPRCLSLLPLRGRRLTARRTCSRPRRDSIAARERSDRRGRRRIRATRSRNPLTLERKAMP